MPEPTFGNSIALVEPAASPVDTFSAVLDFPRQPTPGGLLETSSFANAPQASAAIQLPPPDFHGVSAAQLGNIAGDMAMGLTLVGMFTSAISRMWRFAYGLPRSS